ncbi:MAG: PLP-dependent aminotransferase family protein [Acidobacteriota bacterium]|nr:PLP-dependent aminotransferase family protein [Acidobacteriota bacterium]
MILLNLDKTSKLPLFVQIFQQLKKLIEENTLEPGFRMPSTRTLAEKHGVNRSTVYKAYEELWALGYLESRPGSYSIVRKRQKIAAGEPKSPKGLIPWESKSSEPCQLLHQAYSQLKYSFPRNLGSSVINLASLDLDARLFPVDDFRRCINTVLIEQGGALLKYGECEGYRPLREYIAARLRIHGITVNFDEILITNGSQNGIELILKLLTVPGSSVAVEAPTYSHVLPMMKYFQTNLIDIPMKKDGMDLDHLRQVLETQKPAFVYTMPNFHNPTGITTDQAHREKLLSLCETYRVPILEDAFEEEMKYFGKVPLPIKSMDRQRLVLYLGTFSKILFPGIRIGWIAAEKESIERLTALKRFSDLSTNTLLQAALNEFCRQGYYELHVKRMHREYRKRMTAAITALREHLSGFAKVSWTEPAGGYLIWLQLRDIRQDEPALQKLFLEHGAAMAPGQYFYAHYPASHSSEQPHYLHFRISISTLNEKEIKEGIARLGKALSQVYR